MGVARRVALLLGLIAVVAPGLSEAGRRPFLWAYDTELVPEGDVELEQWLWARSRAPSAPEVPARYWLWWSPVVGLSSHLELQFPFQVVATPQRTEMESFEVDLRYRLRSREDTSPFQPLLRLAYHQGITSPSRVDANLVASYDFSKALHGVVDLGGRLALPVLRGDAGEPPSLLGTYDVALSYRPGESEIKLAAELFGEVGLFNHPDFHHHFVGVSASWTRGRFWLTAGTLFGLTPLFPDTPHFMPRLICAVVL